MARSFVDRNILTKLFDFLDTSEHGLDISKFKLACIYLIGYKPSKSEIVRMLKASGCEDGQINFDTFCSLMIPRVMNADPDSRVHEIFMAFDKEDKGYIALKDFESACRIVCPHISESVIQSAFQEIDSDRNGKVGYREFVRIMRS
eukprot:25995_1